MSSRCLTSISLGDNMKIKFLTLSIASLMFSSSAWAVDGLYEAVTQGRNGDVKVQVKIDKDKIAAVKVISWNETHPVADYPKVKIPEDIVKYQTINVDNLSGATLTSFAIKSAVQNCLKQAKLDTKLFSAKPPKPLISSTPVKKTADIVVIGAGGAGISAALTAAQKGLSVIVLEKTHFAGGNSSVCGGCFNAADPKEQAKIEMTPGLRKIVEEMLKEKPRNDLHAELLKKLGQQWKEFNDQKKPGLFDSPELHALQTWKGGDYKGNLVLVYKLTQMAPDTLEEFKGLGVHWGKPIAYIGSLWPRAHMATNFSSGAGFIDTMLKRIEEKKYPVEFIFQTPAKKLLMKDGTVTGVQAVNKDGQVYTISANKGVIITSGGFSGNVEMRNKYDELWDKKLDHQIKTTNLPAIKGDGIILAKEAGAELVDMGLIQVLPITDPQTGAVTHKVSSNTNIYVNKFGDRFVNEQERRDVLSKAVLGQPDKIFYVIGVEKTLVKDQHGNNFYGVPIPNLIKQKKVFKSDTIEGLAKQLDMDPKKLRNSIEKWNEFCKTQDGDPFGRFSCEEANMLQEGPYYATLMTPSVHHTMGGIKVNENAQVIGTGGKVIPKLFAAGEVTGGYHGGNRIGCNAVPDALVNGRLAAQSAAE